MAMTAPCPCCAGHNFDEWTDLCDDCLGAWLVGDVDHDCARPSEVVDTAEEWRRGHMPTAEGAAL